MSGSFGMRFQPGSRHSSRMKPRPPRHTHRPFRGRLAERRNTWAKGEVYGEKMVPSPGDWSWSGDGVCVRRERTERFEPRSHSEGEEAAGNRRGYGATL